MKYLFQSVGRCWRPVLSLYFAFLLSSFIQAAPSPSMQVKKTDESSYRKEEVTVAAHKEALSASRAELVRGYQVGLSVGAPITVINKSTGYEVSSGSLSGLEFSWVRIPKKGESFIAESVGIVLQYGFLVGDLEEETTISSADFYMGRISVAGTYTVLENIYVYAGLQVPTLSFGIHAIGLSFSGRLSPFLGVGYQIADTWFADLGVYQNKYDIVNELSAEALGSLTIPTTKLSLIYTF